MKCTRTAHKVNIWIARVNRLQHPDRRHERHSRSSPAREPTHAGADTPLMSQYARHETENLALNHPSQEQRIIDPWIGACDNLGMIHSSFAPLQNDSFLRACLRQATDHTPVWLMRQAGRYLPEYRDTRAKAGSFMGLATNVDCATEVTLQPLERYALDASILFSDILTVPDAMGLGLSFALGEGPKFEKNVRNEAAVNALAVPDMNKLR
jgi:hypothetical protein